MRATSKSERPTEFARTRTSRAPSTAASTSHSLGRRSIGAASTPSGATSRGTTPRCGTIDSMRLHSSIRRAASISSAPVGMRSDAWAGTWSRGDSLKEK